jgi:hypothetical protein
LPEITQLALDPWLVVLAQVQHEQTTATSQDAKRLCQRTSGISGVMKRLGQQDDIG